MSLFGGSSKSTTSGWKPAMNELEDSVIPSIASFGENYGNGEGIYQDSRLASQDPLFTQGQNQALDMAGQFGNQYSGVTDTLEGFLDYDPNSFQNTASRDALSANVNSIFNQSIRPGIEDRGTFSGQFGGPQQGIAMGAATEPLSRAIADSEVGLMNADRDRAMQAMGMAPSIYEGQFLPSSIMQSIGGERSDRNQYELNDEIQMSEAERNAQARTIAEQTGMLAPLAGLSQTTKSKSSQSPASVAAGLGMAYAGMGAPGLGSLFGGGGSALGPTGVYNDPGLRGPSSF
jgi:hypothetical protein